MGQARYTDPTLDERGMAADFHSAERLVLRFCQEKH